MTSWSEDATQQRDREELPQPPAQPGGPGGQGGRRSLPAALPLPEEAAETHQPEESSVTGQHAADNSPSGNSPLTARIKE